MTRLIRAYYLATPAFLVADWLWGLNVRVAFLDDFTAGRYGYYGLCTLLGLVAWRRPKTAVVTGLVESAANVALLIVGVFVWYYGALDMIGSEFGGTPAIDASALVNFVLSASVAGASYIMHRASAAGALSRQP